MTAEEDVRDLVAMLHAAANPERARAEQRYLKSTLTHLGVSVPEVRRIATTLARSRPRLTRDQVLAVVEGLWGEPVHERRLCAVEVLARHAELLEPKDLSLVEHLVRLARTWALVDPLAINVAGALIERIPELADRLDRWAADDDLWVRRSALLALLPQLRRGRGDFDRFARYADRMLDEREFFLRKAIGWVLREAGKQRPEQVTAWLLPRAARASGVTVREAVKHLPPEDRAAVLRARAAAP